jgi:hypothetical protein
LYGLGRIYSQLDITRLINSIIERASTVKNALGFEVSACSPLLTPDIIYQAPQLQKLAESAFATLSAGMIRTQLFLAPACNMGASPMLFRGEVIGCDASQEVEFDVTPPFSVFGPVALAYHPENVSDSHQTEDVWNSAGDGTDVHFSILLKMKEIVAASGSPRSLESMPEFIVGSEFIDSLHENQSGPNSHPGSNVLDCCARVLLGTPKNSLDKFTKGPRSVNREQRVRKRDGALAFRTHVTKGHEALRLVMWRHPLGVFEFANVSVHNDFTLCEGGGTGMVHHSW